MRKLPDALHQLLTHIQAIARARGVRCYLVGGLLRDQVLGRSSTSLNVDLAIARDALSFTRALAGELQGAFVPLDEVAGTARLVVSRDGERIDVDISDFRAATIEEDLCRRDFTINAMAMLLEVWLAHPERLAPLIDPLQGYDALQHRHLIPCFPGTFEEDPLRIMRAFRFVVQLGCRLDPAAPPLMKTAARRLTQVAAERIRDELLAICEADRAYDAVRSLNELGVLDVLIPELSLGRGMDQGAFHHLDVLGHQLETVAQADRFLADLEEFSEPLRAPLSRYCAEQMVERHSRKSLIKFSGLLHDVGKPARKTVEADGEIWFLGHEHTGAELAKKIVERFRLSNREAHMVCQMVLHHLRPGFLSREPVVTPRAIYRFFKDLGDDGPACLLVWWADRMATRGSKSRLDQVDQQRARLEELLAAYFFKAEQVVKPPRLITGNDLMRHFHLAPGPLIGELLAIIEEAQAEGRVRSSQDALAVAQAQLHST